MIQKKHIWNIPNMPFARLSHGQKLLEPFYGYLLRFFSAQLRLCHRQVTALNFALVCGGHPAKTSTTPQTHRSWNFLRCEAALDPTTPQRTPTLCSKAELQQPRFFPNSQTAQPELWLEPGSLLQGGGAEERGRRSDTKFNLCSATSGAKHRRQWC